VIPLHDDAIKKVYTVHFESQEVYFAQGNEGAVVAIQKPSAPNPMLLAMKGTIKNFVRANDSIQLRPACIANDSDIDLDAASDTR
jgi:hypothetical protein